MDDNADDNVDNDMDDDVEEKDPSKISRYGPSPNRLAVFCPRSF